jgi:hypothetical protein
MVYIRGHSWYLVHSMGLDKCIMTDIYHYSILQPPSTDLKNLLLFCIIFKSLRTWASRRIYWAKWSWVNRGIFFIKCYPYRCDFQTDIWNIYFALQYVNRQFMAETQFSSGEKEQVDEWTVETVEVRVLTGWCFCPFIYFFIHSFHSTGVWNSRPHTC